jgi:hypothetical protein
MAAWRVYWLSIGIGVLVWVGALVLASGGGIRNLLADPIVALLLLAPFVVAGIDLIVFRKSHEEVCAIEARRYAWLRAMVGNGYSATAFAITGVALLAFVAWIVAVTLS